MKFNIPKLSAVILALFAVSVFMYSFAWFPTGYVGTTKKNGEALGCICHGKHAPTDSVLVEFIGPDSVAVGQTVTFQIKLSHGPAQTGGFNVAADTGVVDVVEYDTTVRKQEYPDQSGIYELTHTHPKPFTNGSVSWQFTYTAPSSPLIDTLYATSNSTNNDLTPENDQWNFSANRQVRVYNPIGIISISSIADKFSLNQNYPNPFNPSTKIEFETAKSSNISIRVYDILGNQVDVLVNERLNSGIYAVDFNGSRLSSGTYFYVLYADGLKMFTKKMLLVK